MSPSIVIRTSQAPLCRRLVLHSLQFRSLSSSSVPRPGTLPLLKQQQELVRSIADDLQAMDHKLATFVLEKDVKALEDKWRLASRRLAREQLAPRKALGLLQNELYLLHGQAQQRLQQLETDTAMTEMPAIIEPVIQEQLTTSRMPALLGAAACTCAASAAWYFLVGPRHVTTGLSRAEPGSKSLDGNDFNNNGVKAVTVATPATTSPAMSTACSSANVGSGSGSCGTGADQLDRIGTNVPMQSAASICSAGATVDAQDNSKRRWQTAAYAVAGIALVAGAVAGGAWLFWNLHGSRLPEMDSKPPLDSVATSVETQPVAMPSGAAVSSAVEAVEVPASATVAAASTQGATGVPAAAAPSCSEVSDNFRESQGVTSMEGVPSGAARPGVLEATEAPSSAIFGLKSREAAAESVASAPSFCDTSNNPNASHAVASIASRKASETIFENAPQESQPIDMSASIRGFAGNVDNRINQFQSP